MGGKRKKLNPAKMEKLALELVTYLQQHDMFDYVYIYVNNKCYTQNRINMQSQFYATKYGKYCVTSNISAKDMLQYCNPETISVSFDGELYSAINYGDGSVENDLNKMFKKYGMYMEQGYPSDFSLYYDD